MYVNPSIEASIPIAVDCMDLGAVSKASSNTTMEENKAVWVDCFHEWQMPIKKSLTKERGRLFSQAWLSAHEKGRPLLTAQLHRQNCSIICMRHFALNSLATKPKMFHPTLSITYRLCISRSYTFQQRHLLLPWLYRNLSPCYQEQLEEIKNNLRGKQEYVINGLFNIASKHRHGALTIRSSTDSIIRHSSQLVLAIVVQHLAAIDLPASDSRHSNFVCWWRLVR